MWFIDDHAEMAETCKKKSIQAWKMNFLSVYTKNNTTTFSPQFSDPMNEHNELMLFSPLRIHFRVDEKSFSLA